MFVTRREADLEEALFQLRVAIKHLLKDVKIESAVSKETHLSGVKLPRISVPTFDDKISRVFGSNLTLHPQQDWIE